MPAPKVKRGKWEKERERTKSGTWRRSERTLARRKRRKGSGTSELESTEKL